MKYYKFLCLLCYALVLILCFCSCGVKYDYDENGEFRIVNGELPEELPEPADLMFHAPLAGTATLEEFVAQSATDYVVLRTKKKESVSIATKDTALEYTLTRMEILDVYINEGEAYQKFVIGDTVNIIENYTFIPDGDQLAFKKVDICWRNLDYDFIYRNISDGRGYEYVQPDREYIMILMNDISSRRVELVNTVSKQCIISEEQVDDIFVPEVIQAIDEQRYADMLTQEEYTIPVEERSKRSPLSVYDYFYFDVLNQYVFVE